MKRSISRALLSCGLVAMTATSASADDQDLAKQLSNPIASLISVPLQWNYDQNIGPDRDGELFTLNVQPVILFSISDDWNVISRPSCQSSVRTTSSPAPGISSAWVPTK